MKNYTAVLFMIAFLCFGFNSKETLEAKPSGIDFLSGDWTAALALAKAENKPIFVDVYATWCGPCKKLKSTFKDSEVGDYFNKNFVNIRIDGETPDGMKFRNRYQINSYPTLLIVDSNGNVKTRAQGFMKPYILINFGRRIKP